MQGTSPPHFFNDEEMSLPWIVCVVTSQARKCRDTVCRAIKTNQDLLPETPWTHIFYNDFWGTLLTHSGSHKSYRPLCTLSFRLNYALGGLEPWGYHLVNILLHCSVTGLFTCLSRLLLGGGHWTLMAGLLFASHPVHTEAVAGIVGRADVGAALFFLLSLLCYMRHCSLRGHSAHCLPWLLGSFACAACSMLWKEQGVTVLAVSAVYDVFVFHGLKFHQVISLLFKKNNTSLLLSVSSLATWGASLLAARLYWMGNKPPSFSNSDNPAADSHSLLTKTLTFFYLPSFNMWLLLCPDTLSFDWSMDAVPLLRNVGDWRNLHTVAFYVGLLLLSWVSLRSPSRVKETNGKAYVVNGIHTGTNRKHTGTNGHSCHTNMGLPNSGSHTVKSTENGIKNHVIPRTSLPTTENVVVFSLGLLMVPFLPATNLFFYVGFVIAERVLYIPSMGFCLLVTVGMRALYIKFRRRFLKRLLLYCTATLVLLYGIKTVLRNQDWQDEEMLYKSGINVNPAKAWGNLGNVLKSQGKMAEAEQAYRNALYYRSNMADMLYNLPTCLISSCGILLRTAAFLNTGIILMNEGRLDEAKRTFLTCAEIPDENLKDPHAHQSSVTSCLYNLGKLFYERGQIEEALSAYKKAIQKMPRQFAGQSLYNMMGQFLLEESRLLEAAEMAGKAAELDSTEFDVVFNAAHMLREHLESS
ncbi:UNVERIFIED_CONTAM: hypothetical protein FKN15_054884 [Acipenser sinensis]